MIVFFYQTSFHLLISWLKPLRSYHNHRRLTRLSGLNMSDQNAIRPLAVSQQSFGVGHSIAMLASPFL